jgi:hypothetical protein
MAVFRNLKKSNKPIYRNAVGHCHQQVDLLFDEICPDQFRCNRVGTYFYPNLLAGYYFINFQRICIPDVKKKKIGK